MDGTNADQRFVDIFQERIAVIKHRRFPHNLEKLVTHVPPGAVVRVLDIGCGPVSHVGTCSDRWRIEVLAVDPLADEYRRLREEFDLTDCGVAPIRGEIETLVQVVRERSFDIVYCRNALDHVRDPLSGIRQMIRVLRPGGSCWLVHSSNEGEKQDYGGLHQWNLSPLDDGDLVVWKPDGYRVSLRRELHGAAVVQATDLGDWHTARLWLPRDGGAVGGGDVPRDGEALSPHHGL